MATDNSTRSTAIHEAGHFVAGVRFNLVAASVSVEPDAATWTLGRCIQEGSHWSAKEGQDQVTTLCAGYAALLAAGYAEEEAIQGCGADFETAEEIVALWGLPPLKAQKETVVALMRQDKNRKAVDAVAAELLIVATLEAQFAEVLIDHADGECTDEEMTQFRDVIWPTFRQGA